MIPTVVIVNDNNQQLKKIGNELETKVRVLYRSSVDGEYLYSGPTPFFEGVIYFDESGTRQINRNDNYGDVVEAIEKKLEDLSSRNKELLTKYLILQRPGTSLAK